MIQFQGSRVATAVLRLFGWRVEFAGLPGPHGVIIAWPHTSNWDFFVGMLAKAAMGVPVRFWAKEALFRGLAGWTLGPFVRACGGVGVDRHQSQGMTEQTLRQMLESPFFWLALSPEGTRSRTPHWRSGFYRVAVAAKVPLGLAYFDYKNKQVGLTEFLTLTGDEEDDLAAIRAYYAHQGQGQHQELAGPICFREKTVSITATTSPP